VFTGIVEALGTVEETRSYGDAAVVAVRTGGLTDGMREGDSLAVNGVCLTVTAVDGDVVDADVMAQTLALTGIGGLRAGDRVNLERAMPADGRFGGHHVQGHVDATGAVLSREPTEFWDVVTVSIPERLTRYVVPQGSITVDGVSLTVVDVAADRFFVSLIPETRARTTLGGRAVGDTVNLEVDILAKYVERLLAFRTQEQA
jgi:riboflavin synthase